MESETHSTAFALPPALLAEVEAAAEQEHRAASDVVRDAVERYLTQSRQHAPAARPGRAAEAVAHILETRKGRDLPEGMTIRDMMTHGRD